MQWQERTAAGVTPACSFGAAPGGSAAEPGLGGFCQLVRVVSPRFTLAPLEQMTRARIGNRQIQYGEARADYD